MHHLTQEETDILTGIIKNMTEGEFLGKEEECEMFKRHLGEFCFIFGKGIELGKSQLQPPVISAEEFLKEKGVVKSDEGELYYEESGNFLTFKDLVKICTEFRQGQKTNQNKI